MGLGFGGFGVRGARISGFGVHNLHAGLGR